MISVKRMFSPIVITTGFLPSIKSLLAIVVVLILFCVSAAYAEVHSTFDSGCEGWSVEGDNDAECEGIFLSVNDLATGDLNSVIAPSKFHGDWSGMTANDTLQVDIYFKTESGGYMLDNPYIFRIEGPGGTARALIGNGYRPTSGTWNNYKVSLDSSEWQITEGSWANVTKNITKLIINGEFYNGDETVRIDDVILSSTPGEVFDPVVYENFEEWERILEIYTVTGNLLFEATGGNKGGYLKGISGVTETINFTVSDKKVKGNYTSHASGITEDNEYAGTTDDPVDTFTGELFNQFPPDLFLGGPIPIHFSRYYDSRLKQAGTGHVMVDLRVIERGGTALGETEFMRISGPGGSAYVNIDSADLPESPLVWKTFSFPLNQTTWTVDSGSWFELLENVTEFNITLDFFDGTEVIGLDNFGVVPNSITEIDNPVQLHDPNMLYIGKHSLVGIWNSAYNPRDGELYGLIRKEIVDGGGFYRVTGANKGVRLYEYRNPANALFDENGNAFISEDFAGAINRVEWEGASSVWVSGFHSGDDDPFGMTFAPPGFDGPNVDPGDILVTDRGANGADEIWSFSPNTSEGEKLVMPDPGNVDIFDLATDPGGTVYACDYFDPNNIYSLSPDGTLTPLLLSEPIPKMGSIVYDIVDNVIYVASSETMSVYRIDPTTFQVTLVASGFANLRLCCLEIDPPNGRLWVTDYGYGRVYEIGLEGGGPGRLGDNWRHNFQWSLSINGTEIKITNDKGRTISFSHDGTSWNLTNNMTVPYQLVENGSYYVLLDPGTDLLYTFDSAGILTKIEDGKGNTHTLTYNHKYLTEVSDGLGRTLIFTYDTAGKLSMVDDGTRSVSFGYTSNDLTSFVDVLNNTTTYTYESGSLMTSSTLPEGNTPYSQTWDGSGRVVSQTDSNENTTTLEYDAPDTFITDALDNTRVHTHTATGELSGSTDRSDQNVAIGSDATGRRNSITDRIGDVTSMTYHPESGKLASMTNADMTSSSFSYASRPVGGNTAYDLIGITHADTTTESFDYDTSGNLTSHTDQAGNASNFTYNDNGQPLTLTNRSVGITINTYNDDATLATTKDPAGNTTSFGYDALKRLNLITFHDTSTASFTYGSANRLLTTTDENSHTTTMTYDLNGNLKTIKDALQNETTFAYDDNDRLSSITDAEDGVTSRTYDELGRISTTKDANNNVTTLGYDIHNRLTSITDPLDKVWASTYDLEGIIASHTDPLDNTTNFVSDKMGRITKVTSPLGNITQIGYDSMGRIISTTNPLTQTTTFNRDARGLLSGIDLPGGVINTTYERNGLGNITQITDPNGHKWKSGFNNQGLRTSRTDPLNNVQTMGYDNRNRTDTIAYADGIVRTLGYDPAGNLTSSSYSGSGLVFNYTYDDNNRLLSANDGPGTPDTLVQSYDKVGRISNSNGIAIGRDAGGRITSMTLAAGKTITYAYDANDNMIAVTDWAGATTSFSYDDAGSLISIIRPVANGVDTSYTYDNDSHLTGVDEDRGETVISSIALTRDANGQITQANRNTPESASAATLSSTTHSFDIASQIATTGFIYDARGRLIDDGTRTYTWDDASRLVSFTEGGATTTYSYDAMRQRLSRSSGGVDRKYVWNTALGLNSISIERDGAGADLRYFIHTPTGALLYSIDAVSNARQFYHFDEMGNTIAVTDDSGAMIGSYAYTPYGKLTASTGSLDNPFTWQGQYGIMDEGNGLYYVRVRYYDANTGRFISRDPIKAIGPSEVNPYQYALNNPFRFTDPWGMKSKDSLTVLKKASTLIAKYIQSEDDLYNYEETIWENMAPQAAFNEAALIAYFALVPPLLATSESHQSAISYYYDICHTYELNERVWEDLKLLWVNEPVLETISPAALFSEVVQRNRNKREVNKWFIFMPLEYQFGWILNKFRLTFEDWKFLQGILNELDKHRDEVKSVVPQLVGIVALC